MQNNDDNCTEYINPINNKMICTMMFHRGNSNSTVKEKTTNLENDWN